MCYPTLNHAGITKRRNGRDRPVLPASQGKLTRLMAQLPDTHEADHTPYNAVTCPHCNFVNIVAGLHVSQGKLSGTSQNRLYCGACGETWIYMPLREPRERKSNCS